MNGSISYEPSIGGSSKYNSKIAQEFTIESTYCLPLKVVKLEGFKVRNIFFLKFLCFFCVTLIQAS